MAEAMIDDIITCVILEMAAIQKDAINSANKELSRLPGAAEGLTPADAGKEKEV